MRRVQDTVLSPAWEALAQDIHAHGHSVRDALRKHRPRIEQQFVEALLVNFREYGASELTGDDVADEIEGFVWRDEPRSEGVVERLAKELHEQQTFDAECFASEFDAPNCPCRANIERLANPEPASKCYLQDADPPCRYHL